MKQEINDDLIWSEFLERRPADKTDVLRLSAKLIREQAAKIALLEKFMSDLKNLK